MGKKRETYISFYGFEQHIDLSFLNKSKVSVELFERGKLRSNGSTIIKNNCTIIHYVGDIPDEYDTRVINMIDALGGETVITDLRNQYACEEVYISFIIPSRSSETNENGSLSAGMMKKLTALDIAIAFTHIE